MKYNENIIINPENKINMSSNKECSICIESYNKSTRKKVKCCHTDCGFEACKGCTRQYLLTTTQDPHCMKCHKAWDNDFMVASLNRSYMNADYRTHRSNLLAEREIARLPESMQLAANETKARDCDEAMKEKETQLAVLREQMRALENERNTFRNEAWNLRNPKKNARQTRQFVMPCPREECRGFLSTQYKCEICKFHTCPHCFEVIGESKEGHECDPDTVATAQAIKSQTKPCPKCGTRISKISGCDQMWCINCHTAFSWRSGQVDTGVVHNPHFFQFQRNNANGGGGGGGADNLHQVGLNQCNQEQLPYWYTFNRSVIRKITAKKEADQIKNLYRTVGHIRGAEVIPLRQRIRNLTDNQGFRVRYLLSEISKEEMAKKLFSNDKLRRRLVESLNVMELLENVGREAILSLHNSPEQNLSMLAWEAVKQIRELITYCNEQFDKISKVYKVQQLRIDPEKLLYSYYKR
jgi:hypothetical protein